jgi:excisionase family DNA binding protein
MTTEFLTSEEVLQVLRVSKPTLTRWVREGVLPVYRFGRQLRFPKDEFATWVEAHRADRVHSGEEEGE